MAKYTNKSKLLGKIGAENYRVSNCPVHLPKENIKFFMAMQDAGNKDPFSSNTWSNQITPDWKKPFNESIVSAISKGIKNVLNESNGLISEEECLRANLVCLYDHSEQNNFFIIKNPSVEDIKEIGTFHDRYYWHKKDTDDKKYRLIAEMIQWAFYNIKLDGLTSIEYDDENINLCSFDLKNDEELYKFVYKMYLDKDQWANSSKLLDRLKYVLNMIDQKILNKRDHYGFGLGTRLSFIEYFFKEYKENLEKYNKGDKDYLKRIKEKEQILSSYDSFKSYMKDQVKKSVCAGDSSRAILLLNLKTEQIFDKAPKTTIHFIKTFQEYKDEMYKILTEDHKLKESQEFDFNSILNESQVNLAIDDFDYNDASTNNVKSDIIDVNDVIKHRIELNKFNELCEKVSVFNITPNEFYQICKLHNQYGFKYTVKAGTDGNAEELSELIEYITKNIDTEVDLNWIDVTQITDMSYLFNKSQFNGDISEWDVSNVKDMAYMFDECAFDGSFSDISGWDVSKVEWFEGMFSYSPFNKPDICNWNVKNAHSTTGMFTDSVFCQDISNWNLPLGCDVTHMFSADFPQSYKPKVIKDIIKKAKDEFDEDVEDQESFEDERIRNGYDDDTDDSYNDEDDSDVNEGFVFEGECAGDCGGVSGSYNTPMNTVGVGNIVPAGTPAMTGAQQANDSQNGSGDITIPTSSKKKSKTKIKEKETLYFPIAVKK